MIADSSRPGTNWKNNVKKMQHYYVVSDIFSGYVLYVVSLSILPTHHLPFSLCLSFLIVLLPPFIPRYDTWLNYLLMKVDLVQCIEL